MLSATAVVAIALLARARRVPGPWDDAGRRRGLAYALIATGAVSWSYDATHGLYGLPFQLCDVALVLVIWALLAPRWRQLGQLAYFWGLAASSQAMLTPDLDSAFPSLHWFVFFISHAGVVLGAVYMLAGGHLHLTRLTPLRVWLWTGVYAVLAMGANALLDTNFGYLAEKPDRASLLDYMGPWPVYILVEGLVGLVLFYACLGLAWLIPTYRRNSQM